jgi:hypothetical protein
MSDSLDITWEGGHPSAPQLDGYLLGEFDGRVKQRLAEHIASCPECSKQVEMAANFSGGEAEERILSAVQVNLDERSPRSLPKYRILALVAVAIAGIVLVGPRLLDSPPPPPSGASTTHEHQVEVRLKGAPVTLFLYRLAAPEPQLVQPSIPLSRGDRLQAATTSATSGYVALYDSMPTAVALLAAAPDGAAMAISPGREWPLEPAFQLESLDPGEKLVLLFCETQFAPADAPTSPTEFAAWEPAEGCLSTSRPLQPEAGGTAR